MKAETVKQEKIRIEVMEHTKFEGDMKTNLVSSIEMAETINSLFGPAFTDYHGCVVRINNGDNPIVTQSMPYGTIYVDLYFKEKNFSNKGIKNLTRRGQINKGDHTDVKNGSVSAAAYFAVNATNNGTNSGHVYEVTKETYEALEEFMLSSNVRWMEHTQEISSGMGIIGSKEESVVCISGLSLDKILSKIYGTKTADGEYEYVSTPSTMIPGRNKEFIMQVCQLDLAAVRKLQRELGIYNSASIDFHVYH